MSELVKDVGPCGDLAAETEALLLEQGVDTEDFPPEALTHLPSLPWTIPQQEIAGRRDLRHECIFTIDPETARDLDDAVSCTPLPGGALKVGVHIADVAFFVPEGSPLDHVASSRATSVYLPDRVIPMLPRALCEGVCSLLPGTDRLAFTVEWEVSAESLVTKEWFGRSVIRSCAKLTYQQAQDVIEGGGLGEEVSAPHTGEAVAEVVRRLHGLAVVLRRRRYEGGALHLYQPKLCFEMDWGSGQPMGLAEAQGAQDSHHLIEELMLMANMAAAHRTSLAFPSMCVLRRHPPPLAGPMEGVVKALAAVGVPLDASSAGTLQASLAGHQGAVALACAALCSKPMQNARYFVPGGGVGVGGEGEAWHYGLNVPCYTHFTSPIRRFPDVLVHRLLAATLDPPCPAPSIAPAPLSRVCDHCNERKRAAKTVQEGAGELFLGLLVRKLGEMPQPGVVVQILDRSFDALLLHLGLVRRVYTDNLPLQHLHYAKGPLHPTLTLLWRGEGGRPPCTQRLTPLSHVEVTLRPYSNNNTSLRFNAILQRPA
ncbi:DIS3-like exonuclease 2 [Chionoecetes opilio]|uniref:DIS3-like exonuclease 2 n=1 Tax=Chionoecetes opilio TaxID=41210 RepID=A0A8J4Y4V7_CHIOP|nr:DIS3-like exonuclease 2 [Chionoecetes opilio]